MKASVFVGVSLDGFIARTNGDIDWLPQDTGGDDLGYDAFVATVDALVVGRGTFDKVLTFDTWPYGERPVFVLTTKPPVPVPPGAKVEWLAGDPADIVSGLSARGFRHAYVDGGITVQRFLRAGLIQRLVITWLPKLIGEGIPLFGPTGRDISLRLVATREFVGGLVQSDYEVSA
jgi:dihydrofolate reductase